MNDLPIHGLVGMPGHFKIISDLDYDADDNSTTYERSKEDSRPPNDLNEDQNSDISAAEIIKITSPIRKLSHEKRKYRKASNSKGFNNGKWKAEEHDKYLAFKQIYSMDNPSCEIIHSKKRSRFFIKMSQSIGTRSPQQCRSHDQKFRRRETTEQDLERIKESLMEERRRQKESKIKLEEIESDDAMSIISKHDSITSNDTETEVTQPDTSFKVSENESIDQFFSFCSKKIIKVYSKDLNRPSMNLIPVSTKHRGESITKLEKLNALLEGRSLAEIDTRTVRKIVLDLLNSFHAESLALKQEE